MADGLVTLVEITAYDPSVTNKLIRSGELDNAVWSKTAVTIAANAATAPDGSLSADTIVETAANAFHVVAQYTTGFTAGVPVMASGHLKANGRSRVRVQTDTSPNSGTADFDLAAGTVGTVTGIASAPRLIPLGNGWWRFAVIWTPASSAAMGIKLILAASTYGVAYLGDGVSGMHGWGFMLDPSGTLNDIVRTTSVAGPGTRILRFASGRGRMTGPGDVPPHAHFAPRLQQPVNFSRTLFSNARVTGGSKVGAGEMVLNNTDQGLGYLRDLGIDGRDITVRVGAQDAAYPSGFTTFLTGTAEQVEVGARTATIRLRDRLQVLSLPLQATRYTGSNVLPAGAEGTADDIKGQPKPLLYGRRYQVSPVLVNTAKLTFQLHDGAIQAVDAVYDMGIALTAGADYANLAALEAAAPGAGTYVTCLALGLFRLGSAPAGKVTADARGDSTGSYLSKVGEIVQRILTTRCGVAAGDIDTASFTALNAAAPGEIGFYATSDTTRQEAIDTILASVGAWLAPTRTGLWQIGQLVAPSGTPVATFTDVEILALDSRATNDDARGVPVWRVTVRYKPYTAGAATADIAAGVTQARRAELLQPWRDTTATDTTVQAKHLLATDLVRETLLNIASDAATEASRLLALHGVRRDFVQAEVWLTEANASVDLGRVVRLVTPRLGYGAGRDFIVVGITVDGRRQRLTLDLWG
jgi:hypothetical protein